MHGGDALQGVLGGVRSGDFERVARRIDRHEGGLDAQLAKLEKQRKSDGAGAAPKVDDERVLESSLHEFVKGVADELFGLGTRNEDAGIEVEIQGAKRPMPEHVLNRLTVQAALGGGTHGGNRLVIR